MLDSNLASERKSVKRCWWEALLSALFIAIVVAGRGLYVAHVTGGRYPLSTMSVDILAVLLFVALFRLFDVAIRALTRALFGTKRLYQRILAAAVRCAIVVSAAGSFLLTTVQLHPPRIACTGNPGKLELGFSEAALVTEDGLCLSAWHIPAEVENRPVVIVTHGLGANKENFLPVAAIIHEIGYDVFLFDFRGHGDSEGRTCSLGVLEARDIKAARDLVAAHCPGRPVYVWATSLGGAAALRAAAEHGGFDKMVVDASFSSVRSVAHATKLGYLGPMKTPVWHLLRFWYWLWVGVNIEDYCPADDIASLEDCPVYLIHGTADRVIPPSESRKLHEAAGRTPRLWMVQGAGHSGSMCHPDYPDRLRKFYEGKPNED